MLKRSAFLILSCLTLLSSCGGTSTSLSSSESSSSSEDTSLSSALSTESSDPSSSSASSDTSSSADPWKLTWSDEFEGDTLSDDWEPMIGNGQNYGIWGWGNNEAEYYKSENASVQDGCLVIEAKKETNMVGNTEYSYTSARLRTKGKVFTTYGKIEARISLPNVKGMWPAFWMLPENNYQGYGWPYSGEIDIMENTGAEAKKTSGALHYAKDSVSSGTYKTNKQTFSSGTIMDFHVYSIEWRQTDIRWFVDGNQFLIVHKDQWHPEGGVYTSDDDGPFNQPFHILLNMAVGGNFTNNTLPPDNMLPARMKVDYVRIYQEQ